VCSIIGQAGGTFGDAACPIELVANQGANMELPNADPDPNHRSHEARIIKLEKEVQELSLGLQSLGRQFASKFEAFEKAIDVKLETWRIENDHKLEHWRKENDRKLEDWRKENDRKLEDWRKENDHKLEDWRKENDHKLEHWRIEIGRRLDGFDRKLDDLRRDMDKRFMWMIGLVVALIAGLYFR